MADLLPIPQPSALNDAKGQTTTHGYRYFESLDKSARSAIAALANLDSRTDRDVLTISYPANQAYPIEIAAPFGYTINKTQSKCTSGTCTLTFTIGATALGGGANSVSSTLQAKTHTSDNVVAVGDTLTATVSANSSCVGLICVIEYVRT